MKFNHKIQLCHLDWQGMFGNQSFRKLEQFSFFQDDLKTIQVISKEHLTVLTLCWTVLEFWKINLEKSSLTNFIFSLQNLISISIFACYTGSKKQFQNRLKLLFVKLDFPNWISRNQVQIIKGLFQQWKAYEKKENSVPSLSQASNLKPLSDNKKG